jgi:hypothetical protein
MNAIRPLADKDIQLMQILKNRLQSQTINQSVGPWDVARLEAKFKSEMYDYEIYYNRKKKQKEFIFI